MECDMTLKLLHDATILTLDAQDRVIDNGHVLVRDGAIAAVGAGRYGGPEMHRPPHRRCAAVCSPPASINAHTHSQSSTMAGFADRLSHPAFMWLTQAHTSRRTPDEIRLSVLLTAYGLLTSGTTARSTISPASASPLDRHGRGAVRLGESGMRVALGMRFFDGAFSDIFPREPASRRSAGADGGGGNPEAAGRQRAARPDGRHDQGAGTAVPRLSVFPAPSNPDRCTDGALVHVRGACGAIRHRHPHASAGNREAGAISARALRQHRGQAPRHARRALGALVVRALQLADRRRHRPDGRSAARSRCSTRRATPCSAPAAPARRRCSGVA